MEDMTRAQSPLKFVVEATAYFLAGVFVIATVILEVRGNEVTAGIPDSNVVVAVSSYLTLFIGSLLTLAGFIYLLAGVVKRLGEGLLRCERWLTAFLFVTTSVQVLKVIIDVRSIRAMFFVSIAFAVLLCVVVVVRSRSVLRSVDQLISLGVAMLVMGIVSLFRPEPIEVRLDLMIIFVITAVLLVRAFVIYKRENKHGREGAGP